VGHEAGTTTSPPSTETEREPRVLDEAGIDLLIRALRDEGYEVVGPTLRDGAIVYDTLTSSRDLPRGVTDDQQPGRYRLGAERGGAWFGYSVGPQSWKRFLHPPTLTLWRARRDATGVEIEAATPPPSRYALFGARACELSAIAVQDRVLTGGPAVDEGYKARRDGLFVVAVQCSRAGGTCFCASMGTGPAVRSGFDLALTEILEGGHRFLLETGSEPGVRVARALPSRPATPGDVAAGRAAIANAERQMGRSLDTAGLKELLYSRYDSPQWDEVGARCLACANCTLVCPTCFCVSFEDVLDLTGAESERRRRWDSCLTMSFSYIHGGSLRTSAGARYRQWLTHKLATWHDQFGSSGCVGCGRCITWCPVGIDITQEAAALRGSPAKGEEGHGD